MSSGNATYTGRVKWFNNKSGYGFITILNECDLKSKDIFAHHTSIVVTGNLYKYLVQGEYVNFSVDKMADKQHENHAVSIRGILGGDLMCETRFKNKDSLRPRGDREGRSAFSGAKEQAS
tara:strand:+ start:513 stop:872 length:360 start_codon:yes stop_codon:yes gene_type:complete